MVTSKGFCKLQNKNATMRLTVPQLCSMHNWPSLQSLSFLLFVQLFHVLNSATHLCDKQWNRSSELVLQKWQQWGPKKRKWSFLSSKMTAKKRDPIGTRLKKVNPRLTRVLLGIQMGNEFKKPLRGFRHTGIWGHPFWFFWLIHVELSQQRPSWTQTNSDRRQRNLQALPLSWTNSDRRQRNLQVLPLSLTCVFC